MSRDAAADAAAILNAAVVAADPAAGVRAALADAPELADAAAVHVIAVGKAACRMSRAAAQALGRRVRERLVIVPHGLDCDAALHAAHPVPDQTSATAGHAVRAATQHAPHDALLLVLLSGGASSLMALPVPGVSIDDYGACVALLQRAGADIHELNTVRKHIDALKGGRLAVLAAPRRVLGLLLSDVIGDPLDVIASGPLAADPTTFADAVAVLRRRNVWEHCSESIRSTLQRGAAGLMPDTPQSEHELSHARTVVIGWNALARDGAAAEARARGYRAELLRAPITGEAREAAAAFVARARELRQEMRPGDTPRCLVAGGETTVTVRGRGRGGRNQEFVLAAALELAGTAGVAIGSIGTDGIDGSSDAAGAVADVGLLERARGLGLEPRRFLDDNDSHTFFRTAGGQLVTGPTGSNVMDVQIALITRTRDDRHGG